MDISKSQPNPKKLKDNKRVRKISLPTVKAQSRISIDELRQNFQRQISLPKERDIIPLFDPMAKSQESGTEKRKKTGVIFDEDVNEHFCLWDKNFPECPERLNCILKRCEELDLFSECDLLPSSCATLDQIKTVHSQSHYSILKESQNETDIDAFKELSSQYDSIFINQKTFAVSLISAGCSLKLTKAILEGEVQNGFAIVRPPGHHAGPSEFCGYSFFNNVALAARFALTKMERVLIVDWDVHHGQAVQRIFYDDPRVLYFSSHRYEFGRFWPHLRESDYDHVGSGAGKGFHFNIPLNQTGMGNAEFIAYFQRVLLPVAYEFDAQMVFVSAGFDSSLGDQKGQMMLQPALFAHLTSMLMPLAKGKVAVLLEGGYCLDALAESAMHTLRALMGKPCPRLIDPVGPPCLSMQHTLLNVIHSHRPFWKCFRLQPCHGESDELQMEDLPKHIPEVVFEGEPIPAPGTKYEIELYYPEYSAQEMDACCKVLNRLKKGTGLNVPPNRVCLVYDADMEKHFNVIDKNFPERPARIKEIMKRLSEFGILDRVNKLQSRHALRSEVCLVHDDRLVDLLSLSSTLTPRERNDLSQEYESIYFNEHTWDSARLAAGSLLQVVDAVCKGKSQSGVGVIRPPGHHAERDTPYGFCFFNNVCIAAKYAMKKYSLKRIMIVDWDVHHGNGIQHCFFDDASVLYVSIHLYKGGDFFPYSKHGDSDHVGRGPGRGFNINIPWSKGGMGNGDYMSAFSQIVLPVGYQFDPDLVLVSAGFDAAVNDPLGGCCVTPECFGHMTHLLSSLANGKLILALEGGYNLTSISHCMAMCAKALLGDPLPSLSKAIASHSAMETINQVINIQKEFWSCFVFQVSLPKMKPPPIHSPTSTTTKTTTTTTTTMTTTASLPCNNDGSDAEFLTPPQSPPGLVTTQQDTSYDTAAESLVSDLSALSLSKSSTDDAVEDEAEIEGAQGVDHLSSITIAQMMLNDTKLHAVLPLDWCPHLESVSAVPESGIDVCGAKCEVCHSKEENWQCLVCYKVLCGRYVREHMVEHGVQHGHNVVLSYSDLSVWCYTCESYVNHEVLLPAKKCAYKSKFGEEMLF